MVYTSKVFQCLGIIMVKYKKKKIQTETYIVEGGPSQKLAFTRLNT